MPSLLQIALLGTERMATPPPPPHSSLASAWSTLDWETNREQALLDALALCGAARTGGYVPGRAAADEEGAPAEVRRPAPPAAGSLLPQLLEGEFRPLLAEWVELCANAGCVLPPVLLPRVLSAATGPERMTLIPVLGERGRWLTRQNPAWHGLVTAETALPDDTWDVGTPAERLAYLRARRQADPNAGLALLQKTWPEEAAEFRERALPALEAGLSAADEPFLVRGLSERRKEVRQSAQRLLARLPSSGLAGRMRERAKSLLTYQRSFLSKKLEVELPVGFDPAWKADGLEEKPPAGIGEKAFWVRQILACVPFAETRARTGLRTSDLVALATKGEWADLVLEAWYQSLAVSPDGELAIELFKALLGSERKMPAGHSPAVVISNLLPVCNESERWGLVLDFADKGMTAWLSLPHLNARPDNKQAAGLLRVLAPAIRDGTVPGGSPQAVLVARRLPTQLRDEAARLVSRENGMTKNAEAFMRAFDLRAAMQTAFNAIP